MFPVLRGQSELCHDGVPSSDAFLGGTLHSRASETNSHCSTLAGTEPRTITSSTSLRASRLPNGRAKALLPFFRRSRAAGSLHCLRRRRVDNSFRHKVTPRAFEGINFLAGLHEGFQEDIVQAHLRQVLAYAH